MKPNNDKLEKYLNELSEEYKTLLFNALISRSKKIDDISISELLRLDNEIKKPLMLDYQRQKKRRKLLLIMGATYILVGLFMFLFYTIIEWGFSTNKIIPLMSLVISMVGIFASIFSLIMPIKHLGESKTVMRSYPESKKILEYAVITQWRELEGIVNDLAESENVSAPRSIIEYLLVNNLIDKEESNILREFLKIRNNIVHSSDFVYSNNEIQEISNKVFTIIERLKKIL